MRREGMIAAPDGDETALKEFRDAFELDSGLSVSHVEFKPSAQE